MIARIWEMLRTKFVRDAATLQLATGVSQVFQVGTTVALALMLGRHARHKHAFFAADERLQLPLRVPRHPRPGDRMNRTWEEKREGGYPRAA